jgi:hypothetical protein
MCWWVSLLVRSAKTPLTNAELGYLQSTGATVEIDGETVTLPPGHFWIWV